MEAAAVAEQLLKRGFAALVEEACSTTVAVIILVTLAIWKVSEPRSRRRGSRLASPITTVRACSPTRTRTAMPVEE